VAPREGRLRRIDGTAPTTDLGGEHFGVAVRFSLER
jgi:hypothetical protein